MQAKLRVCAKCEWIFKGEMSCPKCGFAYYSARYVYGNKAYRYEITQEPWKRKILGRFISYEAFVDRYPANFALASYYGKE